MRGFVSLARVAAGDAAGVVGDNVDNEIVKVCIY